MQKYETPRLSRLGDIRELTSGSGGSNWDGGSFKKGSIPPPLDS